MKHFNLVDFYKTVFLLTNGNKLSFFEIQDMYPWEYDIYISLLKIHMEEEAQRAQEQLAKGMLD